jgi:hypothetical protein
LAISKKARAPLSSLLQPFVFTGVNEAFQVFTGSLLAGRVVRGKGDSNVLLEYVYYGTSALHQPSGLLPRSSVGSFRGAERHVEASLG